MEEICSEDLELALKNSSKQGLKEYAFEKAFWVKIEVTVSIATNAMVVRRVMEITLHLCLVTLTFLLRDR